VAGSAVGDLPDPVVNVLRPLQRLHRDSSTVHAARPESASAVDRTVEETVDSRRSDSSAAAVGARLDCESSS
jgi:hypothetical protein